MGKYKALLKDIADAKPAFSRIPNIPAGRFEVILTKYGIRESQQNKGTILNAEFLVEGVGQRGWAWFPSSQGWAGVFSQSDAKQFLETVQVSLATEQTIDEIAESLLEDDQPGTGLRMIAEVWQVLNKDGSARLNQNREPIFNSKFFPVEQTLEDLAKTREQLPALMAAAANAAPVAKAAAPVVATKTVTAPVETAPAPAATTTPAPRTGLFGRK